MQSESNPPGPNQSEGRSRWSEVWSEVDLDSVATTDLEDHFQATEVNVAVNRDVQARLLLELEARQIVQLDGSRNIIDWVASRLDVRHSTAAEIVEHARNLRSADIDFEDRRTFDRRLLTDRLATSGAHETVIERSAGQDLSGVAHLIRLHRRRNRHHERTEFGRRSFTLQPNLDESRYRMFGELPGYEGRVVAKALFERAEEMPSLPDGTRESADTRTADALYQICMDDLDGNTTAGTSSGPAANVFVDAALASATGGESGSWLDNGMPVGPDILAEILCQGTVGVTAVTAAGTPLGVGNATSEIPPRIRRFVLHRDNGMCTIDGCRSRYRLQPHHIQHRQHHGDHDPENLTTLCWFHHHVVIHRYGFQLAPDSPPQRRRFLRRHPARAPA
jgi:hypothetical protein